jgi:hypothetical protein
MNRITWKRLIVLAPFVLLAPMGLGSVLSLPALADGYVRSGAEKKSFGSETQIELKTTLLGGASEGYLLFSIPQHAAFAEKIVLRVFGQLTDAGASKLLIRSLEDTNWNEQGLTWRNRPQHKRELGVMTVAGLSGAWHELDVTAHVKAQALLGRTLFGVAVLPGDDSRNTVTLEARENPSRPPSLVFTRQPFSARISFCPAGRVPPEGYIADNGLVFGNRGPAGTFGWNTDISTFVRDRAEGKYKKDRPVKTLDRRYDFLAYMDNEKMESPAFWEMAVPNGSYDVQVVAGDPTKYDSIFGLMVEGVVAIDGVPDSKRRWLDGTVRVTVSDGRLTVRGTPTSSNNKISFIEITETETPTNQTK